MLNGNEREAVENERTLQKESTGADEREGKG